MKLLQKIPAVLLVILLPLCLAACGGTPRQETLPPETTLPVPTTAATTAPTEPQWTPYTGTSRGYVYFHHGERDLKWEEDVIYLADNYLDDYAQLYPFDSLVQWPDDLGYTDTLYDEALRASFIEEINLLIPEIPELTDTQILYRLQKIVATLHDAHASVYLPASQYFPISFQPFYSDEGMEFYTVYLPAEHEEFLFTRLEAVNDIPVEEIIQRIKPYLSYENEQWAVGNIFGTYNAEHITWKNTLQITGIMDENADTAVFRLVTDSGETGALELEAYTGAQLQGIDLAGMTPDYAYPLMYSDWQTINYWYQPLPEEDAVYVRINRFQEDPYYTFLEMGNDILKDVSEAGGVGKLIVDLRDNPGGYTFLGYNAFINVLKRVDVETVYVLIDGSTFSNGVVMAGSIKRLLPDAVLVGTPAGQPPNFFGGMYDGDYVMPNCGVECRIPTVYHITLEDYEGDALMPDITVYPTIEDYISSVDTILEAVLDMAS